MFALANYGVCLSVLQSCTGCSPDASPYEDDLDLSIMMEEGGECTEGGEEARAKATAS